MANIYGLLGLNKDELENFELQGKVVQENVGIQRILNSASKRLKEIEQMMTAFDTRPEFSAIQTSEIINKLKADANRGGRASWTASELRIVSFYMMRFQNSSKEFNHALNLLSSNWRNLYLNGLAFFMLNSWTTCMPELKTKCFELIRQKLNIYDGGISKYIMLKNHISLFEETGPLRMAALIEAKNMKLNEAPKILGFSPSNFSLTYFSEVILCFIRRQNSSLEEIEDIFRYHTLDRTKKLAMANLIDRAERSGDTYQQERTVKTARRVFGYDITLESTWAPFTGASEEERSLLKATHDLIIAWYARKSVEVFFEVACQDKERREFWLKYIENVNDFRIVGSQSIRSMLNSDGRVRDALNTCFIETNSRMSQTSALVLYIKNKIFIEFSDTGALYIYNTNRTGIPNIKRIKNIDKTDNLKITTINLLVEQEIGSWGSKWYTHYEEGKLHHRGDWQGRLRSWLNQILGLRAGQRRENIRQERIEPPVVQTSLFENFDEERKIKSNINNFGHSKQNQNYQTLLSSKSIAENRIQIVAAKNKSFLHPGGYYFHLIQKGTYHIIETPLQSEIGSIWIRRQDSTGEREMVHAFRGREYVIGYVKEYENYVTFRKNKHTSPATIQL